jgi:hypothetical protein
MSSRASSVKVGGPPQNQASANDVHQTQHKKPRIHAALQSGNFGSIPAIAHRYL